MKLAIVGVGAMGLAIARRLRGLGHEVAARDIDAAREALAAQVGCRIAPTPADAVRDAEVLVVAVVDGAQTRDVLFGPGGAAAALARGSAVLLCPTIAPEDVEDAAVRLAAYDVGVLDAPMSGGPARAEAGTMSLMVAGDDAVFARCEPLLRDMAAHCIRVGLRVGDGARTKLVNNLLAAINLAGAAEAMALAEHLGLDAAATLAVIERSSGQSWIGIERLRRRLAGDTSVQARVALLAKDSALALGVARGLPLPLGERAAAAFAAACEAGQADVDDAVLFERARHGAARNQR